MKKKHLNSCNCRRKIIKYGNRRRQCTLCKKTWTVRTQKRGRKKRRVSLQSDNLAILTGESLRFKAKRTKRGRESVRRRHVQTLEAILKSSPPARAPKGKLIAVIDGWTVTIRKERHVAYLILLRSVNGEFAQIMEPYFARGYENIKHWRCAFDSLPDKTQSRIDALVCDGLHGLEFYARENGWVYQRCQFHLFKSLQSLRGLRWSTVKNKGLRAEIYQHIRRALEETSEVKARILKERVRKLVSRPESPKWFGLKTRGFLQNMDSYRNHILHPRLNLPATSNSAECVCNKLTEMKRRVRGFSSEDAFRLWVRAKIRLMKRIRCRGRNQQN